MDKKIDKTYYQEGIVDICGFLTAEMMCYLIKENRFKYKVEAYYNKIQSELEDMNKYVSEEDMDKYGRVLFTIKKSIESEFKRLRSKKLSGADSMICIMLKLIELSEKNIPEDFRFKKNQEEIKNTLKKMYENIKHNAKFDKMFKLTYYLEKAISEEKWGTFSVDELRLYSTENYTPRFKEITSEKPVFMKEDCEIKTIIEL